jgi:hypothetical protein
MMREMHHRIANDNWIAPQRRAICANMTNVQSMTMEPLTIFEKDDGAGFALLPRCVRLLAAPVEACAFCEFEVVSGNAAYREGERFYLTRAKAQRAYPAATLRPKEGGDAP